MVTAFAHGLTVAYVIMGFVSLFGYFPQMITFWRNPAACVATPLLTWSLWAAQTVVFHAYAILVNGDPMFMMSTGMFMIATLSCLVLLIRGKRLASGHGTPRTPVISSGSNVIALRTPPKAA
jgi:uncharacterized protein with PQ loop repeat